MRSVAEKRLGASIKNGWVGRMLDTLLKKRIIIRRQRMTTLVAVDRLKRANKDCFFNATIMPVLITATTVQLLFKSMICYSTM